MRRTPSWVVIAAGVACNGPSPAGDTDSATDTASTGEPPPTTSSSSTADDDSSSEGGSESSSSSSSGEESSSSTGGVPFDGLELLILAGDAGGYHKYFHYRRSDDGVQGPTQVVPPDESFWGLAEVFDRRVVYFVSREGDDDLVLGSVDDDDDMQQLDAALPAGSLTWHTRVPDAEAVLFTNRVDGVAYRVDFADGVASPPVALGANDTQYGGDRMFVDATGRWTALVDAGEVGLARVDAPDPDDIVVVSDVAPAGEAYPLGFGPDGASLWFATYADNELAQIHHVDVRDDLPEAAQPVHVPLGPDEQYRGIDLLPAADGVVYRIEDDGSSLETMWWVDVDDGVPSEPIAVLTDIWYFGWLNASADGRWLEFEAEAPGVRQIYLVDLGGAAPVVRVLDVPDVYFVQFAPDSASLWIQHGAPVADTISRVSIGDDGFGELETLATSDDEMALELPGAVTSDGLTMLLDGRTAEAPAQVLLDLGGALPATPVVLNRPLAPGDWAQFGEIAPDDEHVLYSERNDIFAPQRLLIAEIAEPGAAEVVIESFQDWQAIR